MTTINTNSDALATLGLATPQKSASKGAMGQTDFLRLMTEQLKNQDPLKPLEGAQFLGQLAQFSTVQGIENMQKALGAVANVMESDQTLRAAALVGHDALVEASDITLQAGAGVRGELVANGAGPVQVDILDAGGQVVQRMSVASPGAGNLPFAWDGRTAAGTPAPAGRYSVRASAGTGAEAQALGVRVAARVDSVSIEASGLVLNLNGLGSHPLSAVRRIG